LDLGGRVRAKFPRHGLIQLSGDWTKFLSFPSFRVLAVISNSLGFPSLLSGNSLGIQDSFRFPVPGQIPFRGKGLAGRQGPGGSPAIFRRWIWGPTTRPGWAPRRPKGLPPGAFWRGAGWFPPSKGRRRGRGGRVMGPPGVPRVAGLLALGLPVPTFLIVGAHPGVCWRPNLAAPKGSPGFWGAALWVGETRGGLGEFPPVPGGTLGRGPTTPGLAPLGLVGPLLPFWGSAGVRAKLAPQCCSPSFVCPLGEFFPPGKRGTGGEPGEQSFPAPLWGATRANVGGGTPPKKRGGTTPQGWGGGGREKICAGPQKIEGARRGLIK